MKFLNNYKLNQNRTVLKIMKTPSIKRISVITSIVSLFALTSCSTSYIIKEAGDLTVIATRNIDKSVDYQMITAYAGISRSDIEAAKSTAKKGIIKKKNPIIKAVNTFKAKNLNGAVDNVVKSVAGGEYLANLRIYTVAEFKSFSFKKDMLFDVYYVASGDVWGVKDDNSNIKGFHKKDNVIFTYSKDLKKAIGTKNFEGEIGKQYKGVVIDLKGAFSSVQL